MGSVSIDRRTITNLRFVDDIDALPGKEEQLFKLVNQLDIWHRDECRKN